MERVFEDRGIRPRILATLENAEAILRHVVAGLGVALLPRIVVAESLQRGDLVEVPLRDASFELRFEWIRVPGRPASPATEAFFREIGNPPRTGK